MTRFDPRIFATVAFVVMGTGLYTRSLLNSQAAFSDFMLPMVLPEMIVSMSLLVVLLTLNVPLSILTIIMGHLLICTPFAVAILSSAFQSLDRSLEEAAYDLGETPASTFRLIVLPLVMPGIISSLTSTGIAVLDDDLHGAGVLLVLRRPLQRPRAGLDVGEREPHPGAVVERPLAVHRPLHASAGGRDGRGRRADGILDVQGASERPRRAGEPRAGGHQHQHHAAAQRGMGRLRPSWPITTRAATPPPVRPTAP